MNRLIAACDQKHGLAKQGILPWNIPSDRAYFSSMSKSNGGVVLVGSTTYRQFEEGLPERVTYVLSSDNTPLEGATVVNHLNDFLKDMAGRDVWVIGGANVYSQFFEANAVDEIYLTEIEADFGCNQFFPMFGDQYKLAESSDLHTENGFIFRYNVYRKAGISAQ